MKDTLNKVLIFAAGALVGSVVTWKLIETKYKRIAKEEINSVKEKFAKRNNDCARPEDLYRPEEDNDEKDRMSMLAEYKNEVEMRRYIENLEDTGYPGEDDEEVDYYVLDEGPRIIDPDEFGENEDYDTEVLTYYADGVLADERDYPIEDVESIVGCDSLDLGNFGEYEDGSVHVRNDRLKTDYEILLDFRNYEDVISIGPRPVEDE